MLQGFQRILCPLCHQMGLRINQCSVYIEKMMAGFSYLHLCLFLLQQFPDTGCRVETAVPVRIWTFCLPAIAIMPGCIQFLPSFPPGPGCTAKCTAKLTGKTAGGCKTAVGGNPGDGVRSLHQKPAGFPKPETADV